MRTSLLAAIASMALTSCAAQTWVTHNDPKGFTIQYPKGWSAQMVTAQTTKMPLIQAWGDDPRLFVVIMPFTERDGRTTAMAWLKTGFFRHLGSTFPKAGYSEPQRVRGPMDQAAASFEWMSAAGPARAKILCAMNQGLGMAFVVSAPANQFDARRPALVRILQSFAFAGTDTAGGAPGGGRPAPSIRYVTFQDPTEGAFTMQVPQGWRVNGGITRKFAPTAPKAHVWLTSPDGRISVQFGDPNIPPFAIPNQTLQFTGFSEGKWYSPGYGVQLMVMRYQPGLQFAQNYSSKLAQGMQGFQIRDRRDRPDLAEYANRLYARFNNPFMATMITAGDVSFEGVRNGQRTAGYCLAFCQTTSAGGMGQWMVEYLYSFVAPAADAALAAEVVSTLAKSLQVNPQWHAQVLRTTANVSNIVSDTSNYISNLASKSYWADQESKARISQAGSDMRRGIVRLQDPTTGQTYEAPAGSNFYYRPRGTDNVIGSQIDDVPVKLDVSVLERLP